MRLRDVLIAPQDRTHACVEARAACACDSDRTRVDTEPACRGGASRSPPAGNAQALDMLSKSAPVGCASKRVELLGAQSAPGGSAVDVVALALHLRASSEFAILASQALNTLSESAPVGRASKRVESPGESPPAEGRLVNTEGASSRRCWNTPCCRSNRRRRIYCWRAHSPRVASQMPPPSNVCSNTAR